MRQPKPCLLRRVRDHHFAVASLGSLAALLAVFGCDYDNSEWQIDQPSGATSSRGGSRPTGGSGGASGGTTGLPAPRVDSMKPSTGPYGTVVTIRGSGLGSASSSGSTLAVGNQGEVELTPESDAVVSWNDDEIVFRFPFPAEGAVALEGPGGDVLAGEFIPTWHVARALTQAPATSVLASVSPEPGRMALLFDTQPLRLLDVRSAGVLTHSVNAPDVEPSSLRLYLNQAGSVEGVGVSSDAEPVILHLQNEGGDLTAVPTSIALDATEFAVAGGSEGAAVWMRRSGGWERARPGASGWELDKGPLDDPEPDAPNRTSGASSDGSLYVAYSVDTGSLFDDMEAPYMLRLAPTATTFGGASAAGSSVDDYITSLVLKSSGNGLVVRVCGSDVDPFGVSGTDRYCFDSLHASGGASLSGIPVDAKASAHAFTSERAVAAYCAEGQSWTIRTDLDEQGEVVAYPCPEAIALEVDGNGDYLPVVRYEQRTYLLERNPAAVDVPMGGGGAGGEAGQAGAGGAAAAGDGGAGGVAGAP